MKKQRTFWMDENDWKKLLIKVDEQFSGKGKLERFMEKIANEIILFVNPSKEKEIKLKIQIE